MKAMLLTTSVLTLLVSISGCYPVRGWHGDWGGDRNWRGDERRDDQRDWGNRAQRDDCLRRDGRWYCPKNSN